MRSSGPNPTHPDPLRELHASLDRRRRPEDVARLVREALSGDLTRDELRTLSRASRGALQKFAGWFSSMPEDFARRLGNPGCVMGDSPGQ